MRKFYNSLTFYLQMYGCMNVFIILYVYLFAHLSQHVDNYWEIPLERYDIVLIFSGFTCHFHADYREWVLREVGVIQQNE